MYHQQATIYNNLQEFVIFYNNLQSTSNNLQYLTSARASASASASARASAVLVLVLVLGRWGEIEIGRERERWLQQLPPRADVGIEITDHRLRGRTCNGGVSGRGDAAEQTRTHGWMGESRERVQEGTWRAHQARQLRPCVPHAAH